MNDNLNIVLTSSEYYVPYTYVLMQSILENTQRNVDFYILTQDIKKESITIFENLKLIRNFGLNFIYVDLKDYPIPKQIRANAIVYAKMNIPKFIPNLKKCLVFDSDIIVTIDVAEIYDIELGDNYIAWVKDPIDVNITKSWIDQFEVPKEFQYINSGVLLFNLDKYKQDNIENKLLENYKKHKENILFFDQDLFYITLHKKSIYLDYKYNYLSTLPYNKVGIKEEMQKKAKIIHYGTDLKPWFYPNIEKADLWWSYAKKTPFYEQILSNMIDYKIKIQSQKLISNIKNYRKNTFKYWKYHIFSNFVFGKTRERYMRKKHFYKELVRSIEHI